jgi:hypothetical protein
VVRYNHIAELAGLFVYRESFSSQTDLRVVLCTRFYFQFDHSVHGLHLYFSTLAGEEFWKKEPGRYPNKYYNFSTKMRPYIFVGQRFGFSPRHDLVRHVSLFYELSTCELYLISKATNKSLSMRDILRLSFGVKVQLFRDE